MKTEIIRKKLHQLIENMDDQKVETVYFLLLGEFKTNPFRRQLIRYEREKFMRGEGESYRWDEVKQMAVNKSNRTVGF